MTGLLLCQLEEDEMFRMPHRFTWVAVVGVALIAAGAASPLAADVGPVPADGLCVSIVPSVSTSCPEASQAPAVQAAAAPSSQASPQTTRPFSVSATPQLAQALLVEVNRTRRQHGLRALSYSGALTKAATAHAQLLATGGQFTHDWPTTGEHFNSWIRGFYTANGFRFWSAGENLLWASPGFSPGVAVKQWLASPAHRRVMLTRFWRELGVGVVTAAAASGTYGGRDVQIAAAEFGTRTH
jgi:uncharacterized protein YkwD